jgi:L-alanine-DL-glutamate epimerase-like enolase superfamily enzyme
MNRRELFCAAAAAAVVPTVTGASGATFETEVYRLKLRHTWTTVMSSSEYRDVLYVRYTRDGVTGHGEGAPIVRYKEDAKSAQAALESARPLVMNSDPWEFEKLMAHALHDVPRTNAAKAALDIALMDWAGQKLGVPLYRWFGLDPKDAPVTTFSIGIDNPAMTRDKVREAAPYAVLKIKVGLDSDELTIDAVRSVTDKPLRVDANEGWTDKEVALRKIEWLSKKGVEFVEQPMPADRLEDIRWIHERSPLPLIADESILHPADIPKLQGVFDGINVKLDKCGGIMEAYREIQIAKALGMKTMLGCMISSSCTVTAAAHLSPLVDYADLDGNLLISNDPWRGVTVDDHGKLVLPDRPGLGLVATAS